MQEEPFHHYLVKSVDPHVIDAVLVTAKSLGTKALDVPHVEQSRFQLSIRQFSRRLTWLA